MASLPCPYRDAPFAILASGAATPAPGMIAPFALMLLAIALMPFIHKHWWEAHYPKIAAALGAITVGYYVFALHDAARMLHVAHEYVSFLALIGSLYVVSGGIHISGKSEARPWFNCLWLIFGAVLANLVGTTGASMLLIRPWMRMNQSRLAPFHIVFFIFIISNVGGCLTPIGDPPLFLGYLRGVPFSWTMKNCWPAWLIAISFLVAVFYFFDTKSFRASPQTAAPNPTPEPWRFDGLRNLAFLAVILAAVFVKQPPGLSEALMIAAAIASYLTTPARIHQANAFNFAPVREVAWLFAGIFATMVPALDYLEAHASSLGLNSPAKFFWSTGALSAGLDNAPTYLAFLAAAMGNQQLSLTSSSDVARFVASHSRELLAVSLGAVFFGATTYIGNGPNFMVKSIAENSKVQMPSFFAYLLKFALPILVPLFLLISLLFFSSH
jgi:Na+/H+ antiporter NhaD/arsenite permease-like protein